MMNQKLNSKLLRIIFIGIVAGLFVGITFTEAIAQEPIQSWVKILAGAWADGISSDQEFIDAMEFLIESGAIQVSSGGGGVGADVPTGAVIAWWPLTGSEIPQGYSFADGTNTQVPDLRTKFIRGASSISSTGQTGGSESHTASFTINSGTTSSDSHNHKFAHFQNNGKIWSSYYRGSNSEVVITDWGNGMSDGGAYVYPFGSSPGTDQHLFTKNDDHSHSGLGQPIETNSGDHIPAYVGVPFIVRNSNTGEGIPIGGIIDWWPSVRFSSIPEGYVQCAGQVVNDPDSPINGQTLPDLAGKFVRGASSHSTVRVSADLSSEVEISQVGYSVQPGPISPSVPIYPSPGPLVPPIFPTPTPIPDAESHSSLVTVGGTGGSSTHTHTFELDSTTTADADSFHQWGNFNIFSDKWSAFTENGESFRTVSDWGNGVGADGSGQYVLGIDSSEFDGGTYNVKDMSNPPRPHDHPTDFFTSNAPHSHDIDFPTFETDSENHMPQYSKLVKICRIK